MQYFLKRQSFLNQTVVNNFIYSQIKNSSIPTFNVEFKKSSREQVEEVWKYITLPDIPDRYKKCLEHIGFSKDSCFWISLDQYIYAINEYYGILLYSAINRTIIPIYLKIMSKSINTKTL